MKEKEVGDWSLDIDRWRARRSDVVRKVGGKRQKRAKSYDIVYVGSDLVCTKIRCVYYYRRMCITSLRCKWAKSRSSIVVTSIWR